MTIRQALVSAYQRLDSRLRASHALERYVPCYPAVPAVFNGYQRGLLVLASAENLRNEQYLRDKHSGFERYLFDQDYAFDRFRYIYEHLIHTGGQSRWPRIGIGPVDEGLLVIAAYYVCLHLELPALNPRDDPLGFFKSVAWGNFCKYCVKTKRRNIDPSTQEDIEKSFDFVRKDIEYLKPTAVLLAKKNADMSKEIKELNQMTRVIQVCQVTGLVVGGSLRHQRFEQEGRAVLRKHPDISDLLSSLENPTYRRYGHRYLGAVNILLNQLTRKHDSSTA